MPKSIIIVMCLFLSGSSLFSQERILLKNETYKNAKLQLNSGEVLSCRNLTLRDSVLILSTSSSSSPKKIFLNNVRNVHVATKTHLILGTLVGGVIAFSSSVIYNETGAITTHTTYTTTYTYDEYGRHSTTSPVVTEVEKKLSTGQIFGIIAVGTALGGFVGSQIKSGWKRIYPKKNSSLTFNISSSTNFAMLNLEFRF